MLPLLFTAIILIALAYSLGLGVVDSFSSKPEKKKKCSKCKKKEPLEGSDLCYYCEIVEFRKAQKEKRAAKA